MKPCGFGGVSSGAWGCRGSPPGLWPPYQEGLVGTLADGSIVRAVHGGLAGETGVELAHVLLRLLQGKNTAAAPTGAPQKNTASLPPQRPPPYQAGFEGRVQPACQQVLPVDVAEERLFLGGSRVSGGIGVLPWHPLPAPCTCTSAASPGPPPIRWLGFLLRNWKRNRDGDGNGEGRTYINKGGGRRGKFGGVTFLRRSRASGVR